jgi:hypothetical protein
VRILVTAALAIMANTANAADSTETIIENCWKGHDHPGMSDCVLARAVAAEKELSSTQQAVRAAISGTRDERGFPGYKRQASSSIQSANRTFENCGSGFSRDALALAHEGPEQKHRD